MKNIKRNFRKLHLLKLNVAKVGDIHSMYGGSIPKDSENCNTHNACTYGCAGDDTVDTQ
jgi:hypothetical protein